MDIYVVSAPVKVMGDCGYEMVTQPVLVFDEYDKAAEEMRRLVDIHGCDWSIDTLQMNKSHDIPE